MAGQPATRPSGTGGSGADPRSTGVLVQEVVTSVQTIVRKEVELAKQELTEAVTRLGQGAGAGAAAALFGLFTVWFLGIAAGVALDLVLPAWAAWLIVGGAFLLLAILAALFAVSSFKRAPIPPTRTQQSIQENAQWVRHQLRR